MHIGYLGWDKAVDAQVIALKKSLNDQCQSTLTIKNQDFEKDRAVRLSLQSWRFKSDTVVKITIKPSLVGVLLESLPTQVTNITALPEFGIIWISCNSGNTHCAAISGWP